MKNAVKKHRRGGFTLIELVMVILILAIVAGLVVPVVGWMRRSANYGAQANIQSATAANLELFRTTYGNNGYPDNMDSLITTGTSEIIQTTDDNADPTIGYLDHGFDFLVAGDLTAEQSQSFNWLNTLWDHDATGNAGLQGSPGNSANTARAFGTEVGESVTVAIAYDATLNPAPADEGALMLRELYPADNALGYDVPADITLVALGVGPRNNAIGRTMTSPPVDPRVDPSEVYGRMVAIYAVYSPRAGRRAELKCVLNAFGRTQNNALSEYWQSFTPE